MCPHPAGIHAVAVTASTKWVFTGGSDGTVRVYDFFASMNGKMQLTQNQRHGFAESVTKVCSANLLTLRD